MNTKKKAKKPISKNSMYFFGGICLCLISVCLIMNVWYIARLFTFVPAYLFGMGAYVFYLYLYVIGMSLLFKEKGIHIKKVNIFFGILLVVIAIMLGLSLGYAGGRRIDAEYLAIFNQNYGNFANFLRVTNNQGSSNLAECMLSADPMNSSTPLVFYKPILIGIENGADLQNISFGGGIVGNGLAYLIQSPCTNDVVGNVLSWIVVGLLVVFGFGLIFIKQIIAFVKKSFPQTAKKKAKEEESFDNSFELGEMPNLSTRNNEELERTPVFQNNTQTAQRAEPYRPSFGNQASTPTRAPAPTPAVQASEPAPMEKRQTIMSQPSIPFGPGYSNIGVFTPARFVRPGMQSATPAAAPTPMSAPAMEQPMTGEEALLESNNRQTKVEQTYLDFDAKPELDEELLTAKPTFEEPVMHSPVVQPQPVAQPVSSIPQPMMQPQMPDNSQIPQVKKPIKWVPPSSDMLEVVEISEALDRNSQVANQRLEAINMTFNDFSIGARAEDYTIGPSVTRYNIRYDANVSSKQVERIVDDISIRLGGVNARFESIVEGRTTSGLEIPNATITTVSFKEVYEALPTDVKKHPLAVAFGKNIQGDVIWADLNEFPHALVAGTTGSGKSVFVNSIITTLIMRNSPDNLKLVLVDPKKVEMSKYRDIPHLLCPVINDASQAKLVMSKLVDEMNDRYERFERAEGCTSLKEYNEWAEENNAEKMPFIVVILDEYADLIDTCKEIKTPVVMIGQKARACGIHMIISTQRPSTNVIDGVIKGNLPTHIALMTSSSTDSCTIVGEGGAEKLLGKGDMLVQSPIVSRVGMVRLQSCFIQRKEMVYVVGYLKNHYETQYDPKFLNLEETSAQAGQAFVAGGGAAEALDSAEEEKYQSIKEWVYTQQYMSMSRIQRDCSVGFNRAGRFFNRLQQEGVVSFETEANRGCRVLKHSDDDTGDEAYCD